jgi:hypothetical protein
MKPNLENEYQEPEAIKDLSPDGVELARRFMEDMLILLFLDGGARERIGFTHLSCLFGPMPGWYFWTKDRKGVYQLELRKAKPQKNEMVKAYFLLRYYPSPDEPCFHDFAFIEREARLSPVFDRTGTPCFNRRDEVRESLFAVGNLHFAFDQHLQLANLKISSQDRWIEIYNDGLFMQTDSGERSAVVAEGGIDRKVRGWELSWDFFDKLLLGFCYVHKTPPIGLRLNELSGKVYYIAGSGQVWETQDPTIRGWVLEAGISLRPTGQKSPFDGKTEEKMLFESPSLSRKKDQPMVQCFDGPPAERHPWIDPSWWEAQSWSFLACQEVDHLCFLEH